MNSNPNPSINDWVQLFSNINSPNESVRKISDDIITEKVNNDVPNFIIICTQILIIPPSNDDKLITAKSLASILLVQMLNFNSPEDLNFKRQNLNPEIVETIKQALNQNIFSPIPTIRNICARCYSILFSILTVNWSDGIESIVNAFGNSRLLPQGTIGLILIMREIVNQKIFLIEILPNFDKFFVQTFVICSNILSANIDEPGYIPELRIEACRYIQSLISVYPEILNDGEKVGVKIDLLLQSLPKSFQISNIELFNELHQLLLKIFEQFYSVSFSFYETVASFVGNGFSLSPDYVNICISFWESVATFEGNIVELFEINKSKEIINNNVILPLQPKWTEVAAPILIPILVHFMESIDEKDTSVEDPQRNLEPCMYSTTALAAFYEVASEKVLDCLKNKIDEDISKEKWTDVHAAVQMIYAISGKPIKEEVGIFIAQYFDALICIVNQFQIPRLRETTLFVICLIIKNYPQIITEAGDLIDKRMYDLIQLIEPLFQFNEHSNINYDTRKILIVYTEIIDNLTCVWMSNIHISHIGDFFDKIYEIIGVLFNFGIKINDQQLIQKSSAALDSLILNSTTNILNKIDWLYSKTLEMLMNSKGAHCPQEILFMIQSSLCSNIRTILIKFKRNESQGREIIPKYINQTLLIIYDLLSNRNTLIYSESLMVISALVNTTPILDNSIELFTPQSFDNLMKNFIYQALSSENEDVINSASMLIGNLYYYLFTRIPILINFIPDVFETLLNLILNHKEMRMVHPSILYAIAQIFKSIEIPNESIWPLEQPLRDLLIKICNISAELDLTNDDDVDYGNLFYRYLIGAFEGYAKCFYDNENPANEKNQLLMLVNLASSINRMYPKISNDVYLAFKEAAMQFAHKCTCKNNAILNRNVVHKVLKYGVRHFKQKEIQEDFEYTDKYLRSK